MEKKKKCPILTFYHFLGKKWVYPLLFHLQENKKYSFEELIFITNRKISRSLLSNFLRDAIKFSILKKQGKVYILTEQGIALKKKFSDIQKILSQNTKCELYNCSILCIVNKKRIKK